MASVVLFVPADCVVAVAPLGNTGVPVKVGLADSTTEPVPVDDVTPVPPLATGSVPVTPVVIGRPVQLVNVPDAGVPNTGAVIVGLVNVLLVSVSDPANVASVPVVGSVILVVLVAASVTLYAPDVTRFPPRVIVFPVLATPVPPFAPSKTPDTSDVLMSIASQLVLVPSDLRYLPLADAWLGASALNAALAVVWPVPPLAVGNTPVTSVVKFTLVTPVATKSLPFHATM